MSTYSALPSDHNRGDPYPSLKNDIQIHVEKITSDFDTWHDMLENTNTAQNKKFKELTDSLKLQYKNINRSLKEINKMITAIETNRNNFASISTQELNDRKSFVKDMKTAIDECRTKMQSQRTKEIINQHKREYDESLIETPQQKVSRIKNNELIDDHNQIQIIEEKKQDEILDDMSQTLKRLGVHSNNINIELESQTKLLNEVDDAMDITSDRLTRLTNKLDDLMGRSSNKQICLIIILVIILAVMIYFMI